MINTNRIVPMTATDLLTMISVVLAVGNVSATKLDASADKIGEFTVSTNSGTFLASEPVKALNFASGVTASTVYFIANYRYEGFAINGTAVETAGVDVNADGRTLYTATLSGGTVTIAQIGA